jgi:hypothetical protein
MSDLSLSGEMNLEVTAKLIGKGDDQPLTGGEYLVRLFDKDIFADDFLGECTLDNDGAARITFSHASFADWGNLEEKPDFYFVVYKNAKVIFKSKVMEDVDIAAIENFKMGEGDVIDLGTFLIDG